MGTHTVLSVDNAERMLTWRSLYGIRQESAARVGRVPGSVLSDLEHRLIGVDSITFAILMEDLTDGFVPIEGWGGPAARDAMRAIVTWRLARDEDTREPRQDRRNTLPPGVRLARWRAAHHASQGDVARFVGVSRQSVSRYEIAEIGPALDPAILLEFQTKSVVPIEAWCAPEVAVAMRRVLALRRESIARAAARDEKLRLAEEAYSERRAGAA